MRKPNYILHTFTDRYLLAAQLADGIANQLNQAIDHKGRAVIALSGGSTPEMMLKELSQRSVDWAKTVITLVDERCVGVDHELSNAAMLSRNLLSYLPEGAQFVPLFQTGLEGNELTTSVLNQYCDITNSTPEDPAKLDVVVLGMGDDGHTASFFPDAKNIQQLIDINSPEKLMTCESASTQVPRITWSLPMLLDTSMLVLHVMGGNKQKVFKQALANDDALEMPIRAAIFQQTSLQQERPLEVYYAP